MTHGHRAIRRGFWAATVAAAVQVAASAHADGRVLNRDAAAMPPDDGSPRGAVQRSPSPKPAVEPAAAGDTFGMTTPHGVDAGVDLAPGQTLDDLGLEVPIVASGRAARDRWSPHAASSADLSRAVAQALERRAAMALSADKVHLVRRLDRGYALYVQDAGAVPLGLDLASEPAVEIVAIAHYTRLKTRHDGPHGDDAAPVAAFPRSQAGAVPGTSDGGFTVSSPSPLDLGIVGRAALDRTLRPAAQPRR